MMNFLTFKYWLDFSPAPFIPLARILLLVFVAILLLAALFFWFAAKKKKSLKRLFSDLSSFFFLHFFLGFLLFFFEYQRIQFFSARFWYLLWLALIIYLLIGIIKKFKKNLKNKEVRERDKEFKKYLP